MPDSVQKEEEEIKVGDIVQLNSGGPYMTVAYILESTNENPATYTCQWWERCMAKYQKVDFVHGSIRISEILKQNECCEDPVSAVFSSQDQVIPGED